MPTVLLARQYWWGGPPCQGVSGLNADKKGAILDPRSSLLGEFKSIPSYGSVSSMNSEDRSHYSKTIGLLPYEVDSKFMSLCRRPRLLWFDWTIKSRPGVSIIPPKFGCLISGISFWSILSTQRIGFVASGHQPTRKENLRPSLQLSQNLSQVTSLLV